MGGQTIPPWPDTPAVAAAARRRDKDSILSNASILHPGAPYKTVAGREQVVYWKVRAVDKITGLLFAFNMLLSFMGRFYVDRLSKGLSRLLTQLQRLHFWPNSLIEIVSHVKQI